MRTRHLRRLPAGRGPLIKIVAQPGQLAAHDVLEPPRSQRRGGRRLRVRRTTHHRPDAGRDHQAGPCSTGPSGSPDSTKPRAGEPRTLTAPRPAAAPMEHRCRQGGTHGTLLSWRGVRACGGRGWWVGRGWWARATRGSRATGGSRRAASWAAAKSRPLGFARRWGSRGAGVREALGFARRWVREALGFARRWGSRGYGSGG